MRDITICQNTPRGQETKTLFSSFILDDFSILLDRAINADVASEIIMCLRYLHIKNPNRKITMYINSPGGSVTDGMAIYDYVHCISNPICVVGIGLCASMAAFLLSTLSNERYVTENCELLYHQPLINNVGGQTSDLDIIAKRMVHTKEKLNTILVQHAKNLTLEDANVLFDRDCWMDANQALSYGLIDGILDKNRRIDDDK